MRTTSTNKWRGAILLTALAASYGAYGADKLPVTTNHVNGVKEEAKTEVKKSPQAANSPVEVLHFAKGQAKLTANDEGQIRSYLTQAMTHGSVKEVKIASWSDNETPLKAEKSLAKEDRRLAEERGDAVKKFIEKDFKIDAKVYNMAHGTNRLAELFRTEEAELRSAFARKGEEAKLKPEVRLIRDYGKPSTAVLVVEYRESK